MKNQLEILSNLQCTVKLSTFLMYARIYGRLKKGLEDVTAPDLWRYIEELRKDDLSWRTVKKHLNAISAGVESAVRLGLREANPVPRVLKSLSRKRSPQRRETKALRAAEVRKLISAADTPLEKTLLNVLFFGGLRISEALNLNIADIIFDDSGAKLTLRNTKNNTDAIQPFSLKPALEIANLVSQRNREGAQNDDPLFVGQFGKRLDRKVAYKMFQRLCKSAGVGQHGTHTGRKTSITNLLASGVPFNQVRRFSRHATVAMVEKYEDQRIVIDGGLSPVY